MNIRIVHPATPEEFERYYRLRWEILRKPWNQPYSVPEEGENESIHLMALNEKDDLIAVCRVHFNSAEQAQVRFVAVSENAQGRGVGKVIMRRAEELAKEKGATEMTLHARENAVTFYKKINYTIVEKTYLLFDEIQHFLMQKPL